MLYLGFLLLAGILQGVMVSLNAQMGNYFSLFGICFFVHGIALVLLLGYLLVKRQPLRFSGAPWYVYLVGAMASGSSRPPAGVRCMLARARLWRSPRRGSSSPRR